MLAGVGTVGLAGCAGLGKQRVDGFESTGNGSYDVSIGENEYAVLEFDALQPTEFAASFVVDAGEMTLMLLDRDQFWRYEDGDRFEGYWKVNDDTTSAPMVRDQFATGDAFMLVADNTGRVDEHTVDGPVEARVRTVRAVL
jgi:hypothetical protein